MIEDLLGFLPRLVIELSPQGKSNQPITQALQLIGEYFGLGRIIIDLWINGDHSQSIWEDKQAGEEISLIQYQIPLSKSGNKNQIVFELPEISQNLKAAFETIASLIDFSLSTQQLYAAEQTQRELLESINKISSILISTLDRDELLSIFLDQLNVIAPYDSANVMLLQDGLLYMHAARGYDIGSSPVDIGEIAFVPEETFLMNEVLLGDEPIILNSTTATPQWTWSPVGKHIRSWMGVPLVVEGQAIGLFSLDKSSPNYFTEKHSRAASALAKPAALALSNALLFAQVKEAHKDLQGLSAKIIDVQESERKRIAMELHDHSGQALLALRAELQVLRHHLPQDNSEGQKHIDYLDEILIGISKDMERLAHDMRPPALKDLGLATVLEQYIQDFSVRMQMHGSFIHDISDVRFPEHVGLACYRIIQEALTNLAKHAKADSFEVTVNYFEQVLYLVISDNGIGFRKQTDYKGYGLVGIRERLFQIRGTLEIESVSGGGTELLVTIPVSGEIESGG